MYAVIKIIMGRVWYLTDVVDTLEASFGTWSTDCEAAWVLPKDSARRTAMELGGAYPLRVDSIPFYN